MNDIVSKYLSQIKKYGLSKTWDDILINSLYGSKEYNVENFGELYEIGLEYTNKISKKEMGKYYTPEDVASLLSNWLLPLDGVNICDVGCGTGNLILNYLSKLKYDDAKNLIGGGHVIFKSVDISIVIVGIVAFGLNSGAYVSEIIRSGINSIDKGQMEAGLSLGLSYRKVMRYIIMPQGIRNVMPALGNEFITLIKETSAGAYIGIMELTKASDIIASRTYDYFFPLIIIALIYLVITLGLTKLVNKMEVKLDAKC